MASNVYKYWDESIYRDRRHQMQMMAHEVEGRGEDSSYERSCIEEWDRVAKNNGWSLGDE